MKIQGAREIAKESLKYLRKVARKHGFGSRFNKECRLLLQIRPTAVALHNTITELKKDKRIEKIDELIDELEAVNKKIAKHGYMVIRRGWCIHTHCHSSSAIAVIKACKNKNISVIVDETEPKEQGIKTAKELANANIPVTLIVDSASGFFMSEIDCVLVGADALRKEGVVNKIGTYLNALAAHAHKKPVYVAASRFKIDKRRKIDIEERPSSEVYKKLKGVRIRNPAFDITPWKYVTGVITEQGVKTPKQILNMLRH